MRYVNRDFWEWTLWVSNKAKVQAEKKKERKIKKTRSGRKTKSDQNCGEREWKIRKRK